MGLPQPGQQAPPAGGDLPIHPAFQVLNQLFHATKPMPSPQATPHQQAPLNHGDPNTALMNQGNAAYNAAYVKEHGVTPEADSAAWAAQYKKKYGVDPGAEGSHRETQDPGAVTNRSTSLKEKSERRSSISSSGKDK